MFACSIDGVLCAPEAATISVMDHGLLYGDGVFEGIRFYNTRSFRLDDHLDRLQDSATAIGLVLNQSRTDLITALEQAIVASGLSDGYIRLVITRGTGPLGLDPKTCSNPKTIIIVDQLAMVSQETRDKGVKVIISSIRKLSPDQLDPRIKSLNYLTQVLARQEANQAGADEAILLNQAGRVAEGTADNIFIVKQGQLLTPPCIEGALAGITRQVIMELALDLGMDVREQPLTTYDLTTSTECFLTGTGAELIPVAKIGDYSLPSARPTFEQLQVAFTDLVRRRVDDKVTENKTAENETNAA